MRLLIIKKTCLYISHPELKDEEAKVSFLWNLLLQNYCTQNEVHLLKVFKDTDKRPIYESIGKLDFPANKHHLETRQM